MTFWGRIENEKLKGSIASGGYGDIPIAFSINELNTNSKDIKISVKINDVYGNSWLEELNLRVYKKELSLNVTTESTAVKGYIIMPNTNEIKQVDISHGSIKLPTFDQNYELVISNPSIDDETSYSIGMNITPDSGFKEFDYTPAHEPNNTQKDAKTLYTNQKEMSYLHVGDIDYWKISSSEVPLLNYFSKVVSENTKIGTNIGNINISSNGSANITSFVLDGDYSEYFDISKEGNVTLSTKLDYETQTKYDFTLIAKNAVGDSESVSFGIDVKDEQYEILPTLSDTTMSVDENSPIGISVGTITVADSGDSDITSIRLSGDGAEHFIVLKTGEIYILKNLDYETKSQYTLQAMATNKAGEGYPSNITINVNDNDIETTSLAKGVLKTGQTTSYRDGDDGYYQSGLARSYSRDDSTDIVTDHTTGLMWEDQSSIYDGDWEEAKNYCSNLTLGGYSDWRLPNFDELYSITDIEKYSPAIDETFQNVQMSKYWSSSTYADYSNKALVVDFLDGYDSYNYKSTDRFVRCVRAGQ